MKMDTPFIMSVRMPSLIALNLRSTCVVAVMGSPAEMNATFFLFAAETMMSFSSTSALPSTVNFLPMNASMSLVCASLSLDV